MNLLLVFPVHARVHIEEITPVKKQDDNKQEQKEEQDEQSVEIRN